MHTCIHKYIHTYMHAYIHTSTHTYMHTYIHRRTRSRRQRPPPAQSDPPACRRLGMAASGPQGGRALAGSSLTPRGARRTLSGAQPTEGAAGGELGAQLSARLAGARERRRAPSSTSMTIASLLDEVTPGPPSSLPDVKRTQVHLDDDGRRRHAAATQPGCAASPDEVCGRDRHRADEGPAARRRLRPEEE